MLAPPSVAVGVFAAIAATAASVCAQTRAYVEHQKLVLPAHARWGPRAVLADFDGDGDLDLVPGPPGGYGLFPVRLFLGLGELRFADVTATAMPGITGLPTLAVDVDGDGDLDVVGRTGLLALNNGHGGFTDATGRFPPGFSASPYAAADLDSDGDLDLIADGAWILLNDGHGDFSRGAHALTGIARSRLPVGDVDGDGDVDIVALDGPVNAPIPVLFANDGRGNFQAQPGAIPTVFAAEVGLLADFDGDGDLDLFFATYGSPPRRVLLNNGAGVFQDVTATWLPPAPVATPTDAIALDVDRDGAVDVVLTGFDQASEVLRNVAHQRFVAVDCGDLAIQRGQALAAADLDGDGHADLVLAPDRVLLGTGTGAFTRVAPPDIERDVTLLAAADLDGDGDPDLLQRGGSGALVTARNDGSGRFVPQTLAPPLPTDTRLFAAGDLDGDGRTDTLAATAGALHVARNLGGTLGPWGRVAITPPGAPLALFVGDTDGDRRDDAVVVTPSGFAAVGFDPVRGVSETFHLADTITAATAGDLDDDGDLDLVTLGPSGARVQLASARGYVDGTAAWLSLAATGVVGLQIVRSAGTVWLLVLRDSRPGVGVDVFERRGGTLVARPDLAFRQPGDALLEWTLAPKVEPPTLFVVVGQHGTGARSTSVLRLDPRYAVWDDTAATLGGNPYEKVIAPGDLDGDGDDDLLVAVHAGAGPGDLDWRVLRGPALDLAAPRVARRGWTYELELPGARAAALLIGTRQVRIAIPQVGVLRIDPQTALALVLPGGGRLTFTIPDQASLHGIALLAQVLTLPDGRLSPMVRDVVF